MDDQGRHICLGFTDKRYPEGTHICYFFSDDGERERILALYARQALADRDGFGYSADVAGRAELARVARALGLDGDEAVRPGHLEIDTARDSYFPDGRFDPDAALERLRGRYRRSIATGQAGTRVSGEMSWALRGIPGAERLLEYESRLNQLVRETPVTVMCQYDLRAFDGASMFDVMSVHPVMLVGGQILRNPFYLESPGALGHRHGG